MNREHMYYKGPDVINGFMTRARFDNAAGVGAGDGGAGGGGSGDAGAVAAAAKAAADAAAAAGAGKGGSPDWKATLAPETQKLVELKGWKTPEDMAKGYSELEHLVGGEKIPLPRKDKNGAFEKGELERYLQAAGMPKEAKEYALPKDLKVEEGAGLTAASLEAFKPIAHKYGLLPQQFQGVMSEFVSMVNAGAKQQKEQEGKAYNESVAALRKEYGEAYEEKTALANRVLRSFIDANRADEIVQKYGNDPLIIKLMANIGENVSEEKFSASNMSGGTLTPAQAEAELKQITADAKHPLFVATHPDHKYWVNRREMLVKLTQAGK